MFPAEALARELLARGLRVALITDKRGGKFSDDMPVQVYRVHAAAMGRSLIGKFRSILTMGLGVFQAEHYLRKLRPAAVVGFGGYPSAPTLYGAVGMNIPIVLHEQNAVLGRANCVMMNKAKIIATSFSHVVGLKPPSHVRLVQTGNPVRPAFVALRNEPYPVLADGEPIRILVLGGSLGALVFGKVVPEALVMLPDALRRRVVVAQQCRKENIEVARAAYAAAGLDVELATFFNDVPERMAAAHLVICRAGGSTIAELMAVGRPAILVPFPHGHAGEQTANAEALAEAGGAWLIPESALTPETLAIRLESLMALPETLVRTAAAARAAGRITAAENLADCVTEAMGGSEIGN